MSIIPSFSHVWNPLVFMTLMLTPRTFPSSQEGLPLQQIHEGKVFSYFCRSRQERKNFSLTYDLFSLVCRKNLPRWRPLTPALLTRRQVYYLSTRNFFHSLRGRLIHACACMSTFEKIISFFPWLTILLTRSFNPLFHIGFQEGCK